MTAEVSASRAAGTDDEALGLLSQGSLTARSGPAARRPRDGTALTPIATFQIFSGFQKGSDGQTHPVMVAGGTSAAGCGE